MFSAKTSTVLQAFSAPGITFMLALAGVGSPGLMQDVDVGFEATVEEKKTKKPPKKQCYDKLKWTWADETVRGAETRLSSVAFV